MNTIKKIFTSDRAKYYDKKAMKSQWLDPAIVFGLTYRFIHPNESLLDIGIGTGLSSELFFKAGLRIFGIDFSPEMLACCREKQMAEALKEHDLSVLPYPFAANSMDHAVCTGVTHLFEDLSPIFHETARILKPNGMFAFVVAECDEGEERAITVTPPDASHDKKVRIFRYCEKDMKQLLASYQFHKIYDLEFQASAIANRPGRYRALAVSKSTKMNK